MDNAVAVTAVGAAIPSWRKVPELVDLVGIFEPGVQLCAWPREVDPTIGDYLGNLSRTAALHSVETLSAGARPRLPSLSNGAADGPGRAELIDDLSFLSEIVCDLLGCPAVGLRVVRLGHAMCPAWHVDPVGLRMVCTYLGPGTEWLDDQGVERSDLEWQYGVDKATNQADAGEVLLLKGASWEGNERFGAIHRSPQLAASAGLRTLVTLDPIWR